MSKFEPTAEQQAILDAFEKRSESMLVEADAGCAKTTSLVMLATAQARRPIPSLAIAFNKKTATELQAKFPPSFQCKTMNGMGYGAWAQALGGTKLKLCEYKISDLIKEVAESWAQELKEDDFKTVQDFVREARQVGLIHSDWEAKHEGLVFDTLEAWMDLSDEPEPQEELIKLAREVLRRSTEESFLGNIDFDDMIYMSVLFGGRYKQFPLVMVDEVQDLNILNIIQVGKVSRDRIIAVGDRKQSIYQFRGAHAQAIEELKRLRPAWIELPLHVTFRCPRVMVARQQAHAPGFQAAPGNPDGEYIRWIKGDEAEGAILWNGMRTSGWNWKWLKSLCQPGEKPFVLCRNNAPLLRLAFKLIREGVVPEFLGRDIGKGLVSLSKKISPKDGVLCDEFALLVEKWQREETAKARKNNREYLVSGITDRAECLIAVAETTTAKDVGGLRKAIAELFRKENGELKLATGHRAKGLEESVVMHLDGWRMPSRFAIEAAENGDYAQMQQEKNLRYVIETRTRRVFVEANVDDYLVE